MKLGGLPIGLGYAILRGKAVVVGLRSNYLMNW
jgi:hypothetical protein